MENPNHLDVSYVWMVYDKDQGYFNPPPKVEVKTECESKCNTKPKPKSKAKMKAKPKPKTEKECLIVQGSPGDYCARSFFSTRELAKEYVQKNVPKKLYQNWVLCKLTIIPSEVYTNGLDTFIPYK